MLSDILEESWVYQDILQKGMQQGIEEGKQQGIEEGQELSLLRFMELRFPSLLVQAKQIIERGIMLQQFLALQDKIYTALTIEEASTALQDV